MQFETAPQLEACVVLVPRSNPQSRTRFHSCCWFVWASVRNAAVLLMLLMLLLLASVAGSHNLELGPPRQMQTLPFLTSSLQCLDFLITKPESNKNEQQTFEPQT